MARCLVDTSFHAMDDLPIVVELHTTKTEEFDARVSLQIGADYDCSVIIYARLSQIAGIHDRIGQLLQDVAVTTAERKANNG